MVYSRTNRRTILTLVVFTLLGLSVGGVQRATAQGTRLLRDPDVGSDHIVFVHANDIWLVDRDGGDALRLTSGEGAETDPAFSPDGRWIAFTGEYGGNMDVFVVPATGGEPRRLTWHPGGDAAQGWTPDGEVLFRSGREVGRRSP
jgi:tricorn protease